MVLHVIIFKLAFIVKDYNFSDQIKNFSASSRRKSIAYKMDYHPGLVPYNLNTIDKIIEKCKDKVPEALLETLKELPNKYANPDKLPSKILEILGCKF